MVLQAEVSKVESGLQLDLNLEKSRIREESRNLEEKIKDNHNRIDREVSTCAAAERTVLLNCCCCCFNTGM